MNSKNTLNDGVLLESSISWTQAANMSDIKLTYFNGRGRAETSRLILAYAGQQYEDCRISFGESMQICKFDIWPCSTKFVFYKLC